MPKPKKNAYPQLWDLYLMIYPSDDKTKTMARIAAFEGRKSRECPQRFSFTPGVRLAGLYQVNVNSTEDLTQRIGRAAKDWMGNWEWDSAYVALVEQQQPSTVTVTTDMGECPPKGAE